LEVVTTEDDGGFLLSFQIREKVQSLGYIQTLIWMASMITHSQTVGFSGGLDTRATVSHLLRNQSTVQDSQIKTAVRSGDVGVEETDFPGLKNKAIPSALI
jgi:hypothetical protein